ncbi:hypothetical protein QJS04_geneDACA019404 [Acorus gramineus]|uniref:Uncharacterized protein n=1 Tax=Acorus gramineus TaxID=55184 RepID=A0AAV9AMH6_ACOGR|nr:hypothetical protein QJS04_geneDACA019404 [Acorus gramineus]
MMNLYTPTISTLHPKHPQPIRWPLTSMKKGKKIERGDRERVVLSGHYQTQEGRGSQNQGPSAPDGL